MVRSTRAAGGLGVAAIMLLLTTAGAHAPQLSTSAPRLISAINVVESPKRTIPFVTPDRNDQSQTDLYGNQVSEAVATYQLDADGSLYEAHSPQTQLPKLGSPKG